MLLGRKHLRCFLWVCIAHLDRSLWAELEEDSASGVAEMLEVGQTFCQCGRQSKQVVNNSALPLLALIKRAELIDTLMILLHFFQK